MTNFVLRLFKVPAEREDNVTTEDIVAMMEAGAEYGSLQKQEYDLIGNVFDLEARFLSSVMTPRDQIVYFDLNESSHDIATKIIDHPHNRFGIKSANKINNEVIVKNENRKLIFSTYAP